MPLDFHIFASEHERAFTVRGEGLPESDSFPSLQEAMIHLRNSVEENGGGCVVIHDAEGNPNRIPLDLTP